MRTQGIWLGGVVGLATLSGCTSMVDLDGDYVLVAGSANCADGIKNGNETAIDCGGSCGSNCEPEQACVNGSDCAQGVCEQQKCATATCIDGVRNGNETDVDCGDSCGSKCEPEQTCVDGSDCAQGVCEQQKCAAPTCDDGVKNGDETAVDCGGSCEAKCEPGQTCAHADNCGTGFCVDGVCCNQTCDAPCMACVEAKTGTPSGICSSVPAGTDPNNDCEVQDASTCGSMSEFCNGSTGCDLYPVDTPCGTAATCSGGVATTADHCNGLGVCQPGETQTCSPYDCNGAICGGTCSTDAECAGIGYCTNAKCLSKKDNGATCAASNECNNANCVDGVCCDAACGGGATGDCQACNVPGSIGTCKTLAVGAVCRASEGICDVAETCDGNAIACPVNGFIATGTLCRFANGACDSAEACTGSSALCPADLATPSGTVCRPAAGACDVAEVCNGSVKSCPTDGFVSAGTTCRAAVDVCDVSEVCNGGSGACPQNQFAKAGTVCGAESCSTSTQRNHMDACDGAGVCFNGGTMACPSGCSGTTCSGGSAFFPVSGVWHNPARPGWSVQVSHNSNNELLLMWMTYRTDGSPIWYYAHLSQQNGKFRMFPGETLYSATWTSNACTLIPRGTMTFTTASATSGVISWVLDGVAWQEPIQYYVFDTAGTAPNITGNWYDQNQPGWGVYPSVEYDSMISAYMGYDANGQPMWVHQSSGGAWNPMTLAFKATLEKRTGVNLCPGCSGPTSFSSVEVGTMTLRNFNDNTLPSSGKLDLVFTPASGLAAQWNRTNLTIVRNTL